MLPTRVRQPGRQAPLPDAVAVRQCAVPDSAPPFDDEIAATTRQDASDPLIGTTVLSGNGPAPAAPESMSPEPMSPESTLPESTLPESAPPESAPPESAPPDGDSQGQGQDGPSGQAGGWPSQFAQVLAETLAGSRPARQVTPWTTEQARKRIRQLGPMLATDQRPRVRRIMTSAPTANVLEITAVVGFGPRVRALALRLERDEPRDYRQGGSRWCCTAIESA
jgi:Family of unknown function (DUF6459)